MGSYDCGQCGSASFTSYPKTGTRQCNDCGAKHLIGGGVIDFTQDRLPSPIFAPSASFATPPDMPVEIAPPACGNCRFARFGQYQKEGLRECRRRSPTSPAWWPSVRVDAWCGEYQREEPAT